MYQKLLKGRPNRPKIAAGDRFFVYFSLGKKSVGAVFDFIVDKVFRFATSQCFTRIFIDFKISSWERRCQFDFLCMLFFFILLSVFSTKPVVT